MTSLILHIGRDKTGSTSIQHNLCSNAEILRQQGVLYPSVGLYKEAHHLLGQSISRENRLNEGIHSSFEQLLKQLAREIHRSNCEVVIISTETLCQVASIPSTPEINARLMRLFGLFDEVRVLCCVRHQVPAIESSYRFGVSWDTSAFSCSFNEYVNRCFNYRGFMYANIEIFFRALCPEIKFQFWSFSEAVASGDIIRYFYDLSAISGRYRKAKRVNESLSREATLAILEWNRCGFKRQNGRLAFQEWARAMFPENGNSLYTEELLAYTTGRYAESNKTLEDQTGIRFLDTPELLIASKCCYGQFLDSSDLVRIQEKIRASQGYP